MFPNPSLRKLVQISEEALPSVYVPFIFGTDLYILTQQDVRKIEDTRVFSISKIMPNGDLKTINPQEAAELVQQNSKHENFSCNHQIFSNLLELLNNKRNPYQEHQEYTMPQSQQYFAANEIPYPQPMEISPTPCENRTVASIEQQLQWNKSDDTSLPFPMHYSLGTSTTEIDYDQQGPQDGKIMVACSCCKMCQQFGICKKLCNKSTNTQELLENEVSDAREQLKKKKMRYWFT